MITYKINVHPAEHINTSENAKSSKMCIYVILKLHVQCSQRSCSAKSQDCMV